MFGHIYLEYSQGFMSPNNVGNEGLVILRHFKAEMKHIKSLNQHRRVLS